MTTVKLAVIVALAVAAWLFIGVEVWQAHR